MKPLKFAIGTGFGSGLLPFAPGTWGSLAALLPIFLVSGSAGITGLAVFTLTAGLLTLWTAPLLEEEWGKDPARLVMDEWAGQALTFLWIPHLSLTAQGFTILAGGFILFRFFDILKPFGIKKLQNLPKGWGVLADDLLAGLYALICLKTLIFISKKIAETAV